MALVVSLPDMSDESFPAFLGGLLLKGVREIDLGCNQMINGIEGGLCNVKGRFKDEAFAEHGKKLTEETLTSWRLLKRLEGAGFQVEQERHYPNTRKECDLVLCSGDARRFWIEVKCAWKHWYGCNGRISGNSFFKGYLLGDPSHPGAAHDFRKLMKLSRAEAHGIGMLLIGLDKAGSPMDDDIGKLTKQENLVGNGWILSAHDSWPDRRNDACRINCWFWARR